MGQVSYLEDAEEYANEFLSLCNKNEKTQEYCEAKGDFDLIREYRQKMKDSLRQIEAYKIEMAALEKSIVKFQSEITERDKEISLLKELNSSFTAKYHPRTTLNSDRTGEFEHLLNLGSNDLLSDRVERVRKLQECLLKMENLISRVEKNADDAQLLHVIMNRIERDICNIFTRIRVQKI